MTIVDLKTCSLRKTIFNCCALLLLAFFVINCSSREPSIVHEKVPFKVLDSAININSAGIEELKQLPYVGADTAKKIIEHRQKFGRFRKPEHLLFVTGISDQRFRKIRNMVKTK
ncbi:MAG: helix-hairpin-helix domain-containing protein [Pyrinomonadaceae bacterium]|nr:helix-hairpin-helix domain-containing protein [Pyrinomonadaceae bacterium]